MVKNSRSILSFIPKGMSLREEQKKALLWLEANWNKADVFTLDLPVGAGKSLCAYAVMHWAQHKKLSSMTIVPENALLDQYVKSFPRVPSLYKKEAYECATTKVTCGEVKKIQKRHCKGCHYVGALRRFRAIPFGITNYHLALAHKIRRDVLVVDEAHSLISYLQDLASVKVWQHKWNWPSSMYTYRDVKSWVAALKEGKDALLPLSALKSVFDLKGPGYLIKRTEEPYGIGGVERPVLKLLPLDVSSHPSGDWLRSQHKLVLMSATLGESDIKDLGLAKKRVVRYGAESEIPEERRPIAIYPELRLASGQVDGSLPEVVSLIKRLVLHHEGEGGLIHVPYSLARKLKQTELREIPQLLWHDQETKRKAVERLRQEKGKVLVSSGLYEGLDLKGEDFTWQAIVKIPWPYLGDPAVKWKADKDPEWYSWQASRLVLQACGRICRGADDYGLTYILDASFRRLYEKNPAHYPEWWKDSIKWM